MMNNLKTQIYTMAPRAFREYFLNFPARARFELIKRGVNKVALYGAGELGLETYAHLARHDFNIPMWVDIKANTTQIKQFDRNIQSTEALSQLPIDVPLLICSQAMIESMVKESMKRGVNPERIVVIE